MTALERFCAVLLTAGMAVASNAAEIYRWVDDKGVTNMSDVVPEKYKKVAQRVETPPEPNVAARRDAASRAASASLPASASSRPPAPIRRVGPVPNGGNVARPASAGSLSSSDGGDDCAVLQRRYKESQDCFGPGPRTITGAINGARAPRCPVVVDPSPKCGLPDGGEGPPAPGP